MADTTTTVYGLTKPEVNVSTTWPTSLNGDLDSIDSELARPRVVFNAPTVGATTTCDLSLARRFRFTVSQATTLAFSNVPTSSFWVDVELEITNGSAFTLTWPAAITWLSIVPPRLRASGVDVVVLSTRDGGTTWYGALRGKGPSVLYTNANLTTTSGSEVSLASYSLPANTLSVNGQALRIFLSGLSPAGGMSIQPKFGAQSLTGGAQAIGAGPLAWQATIQIVRTGAANQVAHLILFDSSNGMLSMVRAAATETLSGAITIDFRANATVGGQTATIDQALVEYLN